jgi:hypothetical protein
MSTLRPIPTLLAVFVASAVLAAQGDDVATAAKVHYPRATWQPKSLLVGDFSCSGKQEFAILGTSTEHIVVAVFTAGLSVKPQVLEYSAKARVAKWAVLTKESRDFKPGELEADLGYLPEGLTPSKTCSGLNLSDGEVDSAHIYWDTKSKRFTDGVL